jgi:hypothetical protein
MKLHREGFPMGVMDRLGNGSISARALNRWLSSTSSDGQELTRDDGGNSHGLIPANQINAEQTPGRAHFNDNPERDFGPRDAGAIDSRANRRADRESKLSKERTALDRALSSKRSAAVIDNEGWDPKWFDKSWK